MDLTFRLFILSLFGYKLNFMNTTTPAYHLQVIKQSMNHQMIFYKASSKQHAHQTCERKCICGWMVNETVEY